jgi:moderate conductance mechanosensitive channel
MRPDIRLSLLLILLICIAISWTPTAPAVAEPLAATNAITAQAGPTNTGIPAAATDAAATKELIDTLKDPDRRAVLIATLENLRKSMPSATQAAIPDSQRSASGNPVGALKLGSFGAKLFANGAHFSETVSASLLLAARGIATIPDLLNWLRDVTLDPGSLLKGARALGRLLCLVMIPLGGELLVRRMMQRFYKSLAVDAQSQEESRDTASGSNEVDAVPADSASIATAHVIQRMRLGNGWPLLRRLPFILTALAVDLLSPLAFLVVAILLLDTQAASSIADRMVVLSIVRAYVTVRVLSAVIRATVGAASPRLRLLPASDDVAHYLMLWTRRIAVVIVAGYAISQVGLLFGMDAGTQQGMLHFISLFVHVMLVVMVLQSRGKVAAHLRGSGHGFFGTLRQRSAGVWHVYAIIFISAGWIIYATELRDGLERLMHLMLSTLAVGLVARVADIVLVGALDRTFSALKNSASRFTGLEERLARYYHSLSILLRLAISTSAIVTLLQILGLDALSWFTFSGLLASSAASLILTLGVAVVVWEAINVTMQVYLDALSREGAAIRAARLRTIVPLLRNTLLITLVILTALTALSEFGVNIGPLLAGAGIFGVALGFGSQKLVQDFITGIFLLVENAMQVGDFVTAAGLSGTVENLSIRTIRLRAGDGSVHLIPFSSVSTVTNSNRGLGNAAVSVTIGYEEDSDRVGALLTKVVAEMRTDQAFANGMLSGLQLWGVDRVDGSTMTLAGQIVCTDGARWAVQREFNRRVKIALQAEGICMMPIASVTGFRHPLDIRLERRTTGKPVADACPAVRAVAASEVPLRSG